MPNHKTLSLPFEDRVPNVGLFWFLDQVLWIIRRITEIGEQSDEFWFVPHRIVIRQEGFHKRHDETWLRKAGSNAFHRCCCSSSHSEHPARVVSNIG